MDKTLREMSHDAIRALVVEVKASGNPLAKTMAELCERLLDEIKAASESRSLA